MRRSRGGRRPTGNTTPELTLQAPKALVVVRKKTAHGDEEEEAEAGSKLKTTHELIKIKKELA